MKVLKVLNKISIRTSYNDDKEFIQINKIKI